MRAQAHDIQRDGEQQDRKDRAYDERQDWLIGPAGTDGSEPKGDRYAAGQRIMLRRYWEAWQSHLRNERGPRGAPGRQLRDRVIEPTDRSVATSDMPLRNAANKTTAPRGRPVDRMHKEHASCTPDQSRPDQATEQARSHKEGLRQRPIEVPPFRDLVPECLWRQRHRRWVESPAIDRGMQAQQCVMLC